ncbi:MAG: ABC transporter permease [bacterium]|nr:ABC transporter permease [bacterium]
MFNGRGFWTLIEKEYYRFGRLAAQTIAPPVISTLLFIVIFGYSLGDSIREIHHLSYIVYLIPGLTAMGIMSNSFSNAATSLFMARMDRSIENILVAPLSHFQIVLSYVVGGLTRGLAVGVVTLLVSVLLTDLTIHSYVGVLIVTALLSIIYSCFGIITALWADDWDHLATFSNFVMTPLEYLGGVFYSVKHLPPLWQKLSILNPVYYWVDGFRGQVLGIVEVPVLHSLLFLSGMALGMFLLSVYLFQRGWKMIY